MRAHSIVDSWRSSIGSSVSTTRQSSSKSLRTRSGFPAVCGGLHAVSVEGHVAWGCLQALPGCPFDQFEVTGFEGERGEGVGCVGND